MRASAAVPRSAAGAGRHFFPGEAGIVALHQQRVKRGGVAVQIAAGKNLTAGGTHGGEFQEDRAGFGFGAKHAGPLHVGLIAFVVQLQSLTGILHQSRFLRDKNQRREQKGDDGLAMHGSRSHSTNSGAAPNAKMIREDSP